MDVPDLDASLPSLNSCPVGPRRSRTLQWYHFYKYQIRIIKISFKNIKNILRLGAEKPEEHLSLKSNFVVLIKKECIFDCQIRRPKNVWIAVQFQKIETTSLFRTKRQTTLPMSLASRGSSVIQSFLVYFLSSWRNLIYQIIGNKYTWLQNKSIPGF